MKMRAFAAIVVGVVIGSMTGVSAQAQTVLTYAGANDGDWFAPGAWRDGSGAAVNWQDGAIAVMTNIAVSLSANATIHGFEVHMTSRNYVRGAGKLTIGGGGIVKTGSGEFNIQNDGGIHLSESQVWTCPSGGMLCLDGRRMLTAAADVELTCGGSMSFRINSGGGLTANTTIRLIENAAFSFAPTGYLGSPVIILDGAGNKLVADGGYVFSDTMFGSQLILRNGATMNTGNSACTLDLDAIYVDAPDVQAVSSINGTSFILPRLELALNVAEHAAVQMLAPLTEAQDVDAALRKTGAGTLILNSANALTGGVFVDDGWVRLTRTDGAGSGAITLDSSAALEIEVAGTIANTLAGNGRVVKSGTGTLTLSGANTYAGGTSLSGGVTRVNAPARLGSGAVAVSAGASLVLTESQTVSAPDVLRVTGGGAVLAGAGTVVVWSGNYNVGNGLVLDAEAGGKQEVGQLIGSGYTKTLSGRLRIAGTTGYTGEIVVQAGVLEIGSTVNLAAGVTVRTEGSGVVQLDSLAGENLSLITGTRAVAFADGASGAINADTLGVALGVAANETMTVTALSGSGSSELVKAGPGTLIVESAAGFAGRVRVLEGTLRADCAMGGNTVTVSNGTFSAYGTGVTLQNTFTVAGGVLLAGNGGSLGAGSIALLTGGTVAAADGGSLGSGALAVGEGKLRMDAGGTAGTRAVTLSGAGRVEIYDGAGFDDTAAFTIGGGTLDFRATTTMGRGVTLTANTRFEANTPAGAATPTVATLAGEIDGTLKSKLSVGGNAQLRLAGGGHFDASGEIFVTSGGDLTIVSNRVTVTGYAGLEGAGKRFAITDGGRFEMLGGSSTKLHAGHGSGNGLFEVATGGVFFVKSGIDLKIGMSGGNCVFRLNGGEAIIEDGGEFFLATDSAISTGRLELVAGTLKTSRQIKRGTGVAAVAFGGGTLQSNGANSYDPWIAADIPVAIQGAGSAVDTLGLDMALGSSGISGAGHLTVTGGGSLTFAVASPDWAGGLAIDRGTVVASASDALGTSGVTLGTNMLDIAADAFLPNALLAHEDGGIVRVAEGAASTVGAFAGGKIIKQGGGALTVGNLVDNADIAIQAGEVKVQPVAGVNLSPAGLPAVWMDATVASSFSFAAAGSSDVSRWYDRRSPGDNAGFFATNLVNRPVLVQDALNGQPVLDFGVMRWLEAGQEGYGDNRMMGFKQTQTNIRSVFWVIGSRNGGGFLLGDNQVNGSARHFHRGAGSETFGSVPSDPLWGTAGRDKGIVLAGDTWINRVPVNGAATGLSGDYDLVTWRISENDDALDNAPFAVWFASCFAAGNGRLNGGQELAEVLIYTNRLSEVERLATETYLMRKWFPEHDGARLALGRVSLDGAGAGFVNAWPVPVRMAELVVNAADVYVAGEPGSVAVDLLTVTAQGALDASRLTALAVGALDLQAGATLVAALDATGAAMALQVAGDVTLPAAANYTVFLTGETKPAPSALLIEAGGAFLAPSGATAWTHVGEVSRASLVKVNAAAREIWLSTPSGMMLILR